VTGALLLLVVLAVTTLGGLVWQRRNGRMRRPPADARAADATAADRTAAVLGTLGVDPGAAPVTLVQFSSAFCAPCRATRGVLRQVVSELPAVRHLEVDAESHLDAVRALRIMRTPTVLVVDRAGREISRASGQPRMADVIAAVAPYL
jgi:thiol-disulfide isomerase/thioredoxin